MPGVVYVPVATEMIDQLTKGIGPVSVRLEKDPNGDWQFVFTRM